MGLMNQAVDLPQQPPQQMPQQMPAQTPQQMPAQTSPSVQELPDDEFEGMVERVATAAARVMNAPQVADQMKELMADPTPVAIATFAHSLLKGIQEKARGKIPEEVIPAAGFEIVSMIADIGEVDPVVVAEATQRLLLRFLVDKGVNPREVEQAMSMVDFKKIAGAATAQPQSNGEDDGAR